MANYNEARINLTHTQLNKLKSTAKKKNRNNIKIK